MEASIPGVTIQKIMTVGDSFNLKPDGVTPYRMVGMPDGMGAFDNRDGTFTLLMNQEISRTAGIPRAHGARGAFVSKWIISKEDLSVINGEDLTKQLVLWNPTLGAYDPPLSGPTAAINRLCSANLPSRSAYFDRRTGLGFDGRLFMSGEEGNRTSRGFAHGLDGTSYELPRLGKMPFENLLANPASGAKTVVAVTDDSTDSQVYIYVGDKTSSGATPADLAGLNNGKLYGIKVPGYRHEVLPASPPTIPALCAATPPATPLAAMPAGFSGAFTLHELGDVSSWSGDRLQNESRCGEVTEFNKVEDGHWDPKNPNDFYFVTTLAPSRLWRLRFNDVKDPTLGGTIEMILNGTEGQRDMDNMTVSRRGEVLMQEDPGFAPDYLAKVWRLDLRHGGFEEIAHLSPRFFATASPDFITSDAESSGVFDISRILGPGWFLAVVQAHTPNPDPELIEKGQLVALRIHPGHHGHGHGGGHDHGRGRCDRDDDHDEDDND